MAKRKQGASASGEPAANSPGTSKDSGKKPKKAEKKEKEVRVDKFGKTVRYRGVPSEKVQERVERAFQHRLFLLGRERVEEGAESFDVLGATGNVYTVCISCQPSCTCPDHLRGNICKHLLFVIARVLRRGTVDPLLWQAALLPSEVRTLLGPMAASSAANATELEGAGLLVASPELRAEYSRAKGEGAAAGPSAAAAAPREDDDCPVCFESFGACKEAVSSCGTCRHCIHTECLTKWAQSLQKQGQPATCPLCRSSWAASIPGLSGIQTPKKGGYINLSQHSASHRNVSLEELYPFTHEHITGRRR